MNLKTMRESSYKYIFWSILLGTLAFLLLISIDAGITCDEVLHYSQSQEVQDFFATKGQDRNALHNPVWHLAYYGQSYDNIVTFIAGWAGIDDIYTFRHIMSALAGWLTILVTALFAKWISGYRSAVFAVLLFAITPAFIGHSQNNLKDIPFALGYISSTFLMIRFLDSQKRDPVRYVALLILAVGFTISIRAAGAVLIIYAGLYFVSFYLMQYFEQGNVDKAQMLNRFMLVFFISAAAFFMSVLLWPYALLDPLRNVYRAYHVMANFPDTFRQLFEGIVEWSDHMSWYYLPKSMLITIPLTLLSGLLFFIVFSCKIFKGRNILPVSLVVFTILFPVLFAIVQKTNLYSSWRQFLFVFPAIVLLAAIGFEYLAVTVRKKSVLFLFAVLFLLSVIHPVTFMFKNPHYSYIYYNQLVGGLKGAYGNYETDYYYVSQTEASEWLIDYLQKKGIKGKIRIAATYSVAWQFRKMPEAETFYIRYEERSQSDWDYAIIVNRYIPPGKLKKGLWPSDNAIHIIYADGVPVCEVVERHTKEDYLGYKALENKDYEAAVTSFEEALKIIYNDEMIFFNFAAAHQNMGNGEEARIMLGKALGINPDFEPALMYLGNIAVSAGRTDEAAEYYEKVLSLNRKYFEAYIKLAALYQGSDIRKARALLRKCIVIHPGYKPAIIALADTYRKTDPDVAAKYDKLADSI